jgi:hypothetical protein
MTKNVQDRSKLTAQEKKLKEDYEVLEKELIGMMKVQKTDVSMHDNVKATLKTTHFPKITDDAQLWKYIKKHDYYHLYYRRLNQTSYEELLGLNKGQPLPGTEVSEKVSISLSGAKQL